MHSGFLIGKNYELGRKFMKLQDRSLLVFGNWYLSVFSIKEMVSKIALKIGKFCDIVFTKFRNLNVECKVKAAYFVISEKQKRTK